ncbi:hypothetical protein AG4045_028752 [Apium graveolens]|nr:hypothetical protein AG4045_028752 [Apium graveolens]
MVIEMFPSVQFDSRGIPNQFGHSKDYCSREEVNTERNQWYGTEEFVQWGNINLFHQNTMINENLSLPTKQQGLIFSAEITNFDELCYDIKPSSSQLCPEELKNFETIHSEFQELISPQESSSGITINHETKFGQADYEQFNLPSHDTACANAGKRLSTHDFFCVWVERKEHRDVEIIQHLLASAEKVGEQQFSRASHLLSHCHQCSSIRGTPVQRIVYYFSKALQQKIDQETGRRTTKGSGKRQLLELQDTSMNPNPSLLASYQKKIKETGKRLMSVAQSLNLSFSFNVVMVADMLDLNESLFKLESEEMVAVYAPYILSTLIERPNHLENLMAVFQKINPRIMIVTEVEANHNSPVFVNRFVEALFYYGALFDSMEECMDRDDQDRIISESTQFSPKIANIVAFEGEERRVRHVNSNVWKAFFSRFGMVETELSRASLYQAKLLVNNFACASSCTFEMMGKSLSIGWKGTPILSVSALKFL